MPTLTIRCRHGGTCSSLKLARSKAAARLRRQALNRGCRRAPDRAQLAMLSPSPSFPLAFSGFYAQTTPGPYEEGDNFFVVLPGKESASNAPHHLRFNSYIDKDHGALLWRGGAFQRAG